MTKDSKKDWKVIEGQPAIDLYETEKELVVQTAIAGIKTEQIDISLENDILIIKGKRENPVLEDNKIYFTRECYFGPFSREIILPREVNTATIKAGIKEGVLTIRMNKIEREKSKKINIEK